MENRGLSMRCFPAQDQGIRADAGHAGEPHSPLEADTRLGDIDMHGPNDLATARYLSKMRRGCSGRPAKNPSTLPPVQHECHMFAVTNRFPQLGHRQGDVHRLPRREATSAHLTCEAVGARDGAGCDRRATAGAHGADPRAGPRPRPALDRRLWRLPTDLHVIDGDLADPAPPLVLGHQVVGVVDALGTDVETLELGLRVGVPWLRWTCGTCRFCRSGRENLCPEARFTGFQLPGGFAEGMVVDACSCLPIPRLPGPAGGSVALCRVDRLAVPEARGEADRLGIYGFGAAAHLVAQVARWQGRELFAFTPRRRARSGVRARARMRMGGWLR